MEKGSTTGRLARRQALESIAVIAFLIVGVPKKIFEKN